MAIVRLLQCKGVCFGCFSFEIGKRDEGLLVVFPSSFGRKMYGGASSLEKSRLSVSYEINTCRGFP